MICLLNVLDVDMNIVHQNQNHPIHLDSSSTRPIVKAQVGIIVVAIFIL